MKKLVAPLLSLFLVASIATAFIGAFHAGAAHAQPDGSSVPVFVDAGAIPDAAPAAGSAVALPDPIAQPVESVSYIVKLWKTGTIPATVIVGLFLVLTALSRKVKFLQSGYAAIAVAALLGGCSMLIERAAAGTTPNAAMFMTALVTALALALKPKQPMGPPAPPAT